MFLGASSTTLYDFGLMVLIYSSKPKRVRVHRFRGDCDSIGRGTMSAKALSRYARFARSNRVSATVIDHERARFNHRARFLCIVREGFLLFFTKYFSRTLLTRTDRRPLAPNTLAAFLALSRSLCGAVLLKSLRK